MTDRDNILKSYDDEIQRIFTIFCMSGDDRSFGQNGLSEFKTAVVRMRKARDLALDVLGKLDL